MVHGDYITLVPVTYFLEKPRSFPPSGICEFKGALIQNTGGKSWFKEGRHLMETTL